MSDLKTLKDFEKELQPHPNIIGGHDEIRKANQLMFTTILKNEAIKRVKFFLSKLAGSVEISEITDRHIIVWKENNAYNFEYVIMGRIEELVDFYNLNLEDLK